MALVVAELTCHSQNTTTARTAFPNFRDLLARRLRSERTAPSRPLLYARLRLAKKGRSALALRLLRCRRWRRRGNDPVLVTEAELPHFLERSELAESDERSRELRVLGGRGRDDAGKVIRQDQGRGLPFVASQPA